MANSTIEKKAVNIIKDALLSTEYLDPFIQDGDKEPSYDGMVYIYSNLDGNKKNAKRVPVQVKGRTGNPKKSNTVSFSLNVVDLENYLNNGGCFYFVVQISKDMATYDIYYNDLTPMKIKKILGRSKKQATASDKFRRFPSDKSDIINAFLEFHKNTNMQMSFINTDLPSLANLEKQGDISEITAVVGGQRLNIKPCKCQ